MATPTPRRSAIEDAAHCLYRYNKLWNEGAPDKSDYSLRGIGYHVVKYLYVMRLVAAKTPADSEEAREAFTEGIAESKTPPELVEEIRRLFDRHCEWFQLDLDRFLTAEERQHSKDGSFAPDLVYAGDKELEIVDDKTFYVSASEAQVRAMFQTRFYARRAMERWPGFQSYRFTMNWVRLGECTSVVFQPDDLEDLDREVTAVMALIHGAEKDGIWPAHAGPQCGYCALECPLEASGANVPIRIQSEADARLMAGIIHVTDTRQKMRKKTLKRWAMANGKVPVDAFGGLVFDHYPSESVTYPAEKVLEVLQARQIPALFNLSRSALKPLFKIHKSLPQDLAIYATTKTRHTFSAKKVLETHELGPGDDEEEDDDAE